jgi:hypothetical protein
MTKDIIKLATEAGGREVAEADPQCFVGMMAFDVEELERFANLVAAHVRKQVTKDLSPFVRSQP